jgi:hypothetical protein
MPPCGITDVAWLPHGRIRGVPIAGQRDTMMNWVGKRLALRSYRRKLGPALRKRYGHQLSYTIDQVVATINSLNLSGGHLRYAHAYFCSELDYVAHHAPSSSALDWAQLRDEMATWWSSDQAHDASGGDSHDSSECGGDDGD